MQKLREKYKKMHITLRIICIVVTIWLTTFFYQLINGKIINLSHVLMSPFLLLRDLLYSIALNPFTLLTTVAVLLMLYTKNRKSKEHLNVSQKKKINTLNVATFIILGFAIVLPGLFGINLYLRYFSPSSSFIKQMNQEDAERLKMQPYTQIQFMQHDYILGQCFEALPPTFKFYKKHVLQWNVYIPKNTPLSQFSAPKLPIIILEAPNNWTCQYSLQ